MYIILTLKNGYNLFNFIESKPPVKLVVFLQRDTQLKNKMSIFFFYFLNLKIFFFKTIDFKIIM